MTVERMNESGEKLDSVRCIEGSVKLDGYILQIHGIMSGYYRDYSMILEYGDTVVIKYI